MQSLLCLDFSSQILEAGIVSYDEKNARLSLEQVVREDDPKLFAHPSQVNDQTPATPQEPVETPSLSLESRLQKLIGSLKELLAQDTAGSTLSFWNSIVAIVPSRNTFSLVMPLPIADPRMIQKVLPLEIEDALPISIEPFHVESYIAGLTGEKGAKVLTTLAPKNILNEHLTPLRNLGLEPDTFTTFEGVISSLGSCVTDEAGNFILLCQDRANTSHWAIAAFIKHEVRHCEHLYADPSRLGQALKSLVLISESSFGEPINTVYSIGSCDAIPNVAITSAPLKYELQRFNSSPNYLAALSALVIEGNQSPENITKTIPAINFRSGEFSYKLQLRELLNSLRRLLPSMLGCFGTMLLALMIWYAVRAYSIMRLNERAREEIATVLNAPTIETSSAPQTLRLRIEEIRAQLRDLGSVGKISPLDALLGITKDFPLQDQVEVRSIAIKEKKITIEGSAPEYDSIDKMERALQSKRSTYCRVKSTSAKKGDMGVDFNFEIYLCD